MFNLTFYDLCEIKNRGDLRLIVLCIKKFAF